MPRTALRSALAAGLAALVTLLLAAVAPAAGATRLQLRIEPGPLSGTVRAVAPVRGAAPRGVVFAVDGVRRARDTRSPFVFRWGTGRYANGRHSIVARVPRTKARAVVRRTVLNSRTVRPGRPLPSGAQCAAGVRRSPWEPRPENLEANSTVPPPSVFAEIDGGDAIAQERFLPRIDGRFTGTTPEIIKWAACKWGFDKRITRARVWTESSWRQATVGDGGRSFGLLQVKRTVHGGHPWTAEATALNVDYALGWLRSCYEGWMSHWLPRTARGDEWGCVGLWYSGEWKRGSREYLADVRRNMRVKPWLALH